MLNLLPLAIITDVGLNHIADQMAEQNEGQMSHIAVGTNNTAEDASDTALVAELFRKALDAGYPKRSGAKTIYKTTLNAGEGTGALVEMGVFNAAAVGSMLDRITFPVNNKGANDSLVVTVEVTFSR